MATGIAAKEFLSALYNHFGELSGKSIKYITKVGEESGSGPMLSKVAEVMNPQKRGVIAANLMDLNELVETVGNNPYLLRGGKPTAFVHQGRTAIPPGEVLGKANPELGVLTVPHEGRHLQEFYGLTDVPVTGKVRGIDNPPYLERFPAFMESFTPEGKRLKSTKSIPLGTYADWNKTYYGHMYGTKAAAKQGPIGFQEIDAMLSEMGTGEKAGLLKTMKSNRISDMWNRMPDKVKQYYIDTAGVAGIGSASLLKKWSSPDVEQGSVG